MHKAWLVLVGLLLVVMVNVATVALTMGWGYTKDLVWHRNELQSVMVGDEAHFFSSNLANDLLVEREAAVSSDRNIGDCMG